MVSRNQRFVSEIEEKKKNLVLMAIGPEGRTFEEIVNFLEGKVSRSTIARHLKNLEKEGIIERIAIPGERRIEYRWKNIEKRKIISRIIAFLSFINFVEEAIIKNFESLPQPRNRDDLLSNIKKYYSQFHRKLGEDIASLCMLKEEESEEILITFVRLVRWYLRNKSDPIVALIKKSKRVGEIEIYTEFDSKDKQLISNMEKKEEKELIQLLKKTLEKYRDEEEIEKILFS